MERKKFLLFIGTLVIFVLLILTAVIVIVVMPQDNSDADINLAKYYREKKAGVLDSIKNVKFVNVMDYIKDPNDPIPGINKALQYNHYVLFPQSLSYVLNGKIIPKNDSIIMFEKNSRILGAYPSKVSPLDHCLFFFYGVKNVTIIGNGATIRTLEAGAPEAGFPTIGIFGGQKISIFDLSLESPVSHGIVVSRFIHAGLPEYRSEDVDLLNIDIKDAKKGGLLLESVHGTKVYKLSVSGTQGQAPENGVTIQTQRPHDSLAEIQMEEISTWNNVGVGMAILPGIHMEQKFSLFLHKYNSTSDGQFAPLYMMNSPNGKITLKDLRVKHKEAITAVFRTWDTRKCEIEVSSPVVNGENEFKYVINDKKGDPFETNMEKLHINK